MKQGTKIKFYTEKETADLKAMLTKRTKGDIETFMKKYGRSRKSVEQKLHSIRKAGGNKGKRGRPSNKAATINTNVVRIPFTSFSLNFETRMIELSW